MIEQLLLVLLLVYSVIIVFSKHLRCNVIHLGLVSLLCAILLIVYSAPDVAMAEAVIGGLSTILFLIAVKQIDHFTLFVIVKREAGGGNPLKPEIEAVIHEIKAILKTRGVSCIVKYSESDDARIEQYVEADLVLCYEGEIIRMLGVSQELNLDLIEAQIDNGNPVFDRCTWRRLAASPEYKGELII